MKSKAIYQSDGHGHGQGVVAVEIILKNEIDLLLKRRESRERRETRAKGEKGEKIKIKSQTKYFLYVRALRRSGMASFGHGNIYDTQNTCVQV